MPSVTTVNKMEKPIAALKLCCESLFGNKSAIITGTNGRLPNRRKLWNVILPSVIGEPSSCGHGCGGCENIDGDLKGKRNKGKKKKEKSWETCRVALLCDTATCGYEACVFTCTATHCNTLQHTATHCETATCGCEACAFTHICVYVHYIYIRCIFLVVHSTLNL